MNEDYLKGFRKSPDVQMLDKIQARLQRRERSQKIKQYITRSVLALILAFGMLLTFSPTVRAQVLYYWKKIAGVTFWVYNDLPADAYTLKVDDYWTLEEAQTRFPSPISLPSYVPQGYERIPTVQHILDGHVDIVTVTWKNDYETIDLWIQHCFPDLEFDGVKGANCGAGVIKQAIEKITLNGKPAALVYDPRISESRNSAGLSIFWLYNENTVYSLGVSGKYLSKDEIIKMAESIP
jgi:uncharacterized protein DUF4367